MVLSEAKWNEVTEQIGATFRLSDCELEKLRDNAVAKLVAAIPYNAECNHQDRTALAHLGIYMMAKDPACKEQFGHTAEDNTDLLRRLTTANAFDGGDQEIIDRGLNMLALIQLEDHYHDQDEDKDAQKYNPVLAGAWDYEATKTGLVEKITAVPCEEMDYTMRLDQVRGWWDPN